MQWRSNGHRKVCVCVGVNCGSWQEKDKPSKLTSKKAKQKTKNKTKQKQKWLAHSDTRQTGQSQIGFQFLLIIWNFRHNNRLQFQISFSVGSIRRCSNAKGRIEVKLANVRRCRQMFFTLVVVNYQRRETKGQTMIYKALHRKQWSSNMYMYIHKKTR